MGERAHIMRRPHRDRGIRRCRWACWAISVAGALAALMAAAPAGSAYTPPPAIGWSGLLPALPVASHPQFTGGTGCARATLACVDGEVRRMHAIRTGLGCDHLAVFDTTYELITITIRGRLRDTPYIFHDPAWVIGEDATFANLYFDALNAWQHGRPVPGAWRIAFQAAATGNYDAVQDLLLGANAHIQRDLPYMLAAVGLAGRDGTSHKPDHDRVDAILNQTYPSVLDTIAERFQPIDALAAPGFDPVGGLVGNFTASQLLETWRELAWRNAERLLNARTQSEQARVEASIEANATMSARAIAAIPMPAGYRTARDAYCAAHNYGPLP